MMSAPPAFNNSRVCPATTQMTIHRRPDLRFRRLGHFRQKLGSLDDHPVVAVAALNRLLVNERLLYWVEHGRLLEPILLCVPGRQPFECRDRLALERSHRRHARTLFNAVDEDRAGAALRQPAAKS